MKLCWKSMSAAIDDGLIHFDLLIIVNCSEFVGKFDSNHFILIRAHFIFLYFPLEFLFDLICNKITKLSENWSYHLSTLGQRSIFQFCTINNNWTYHKHTGDFSILWSRLHISASRCPIDDDTKPNCNEMKFRSSAMCRLCTKRSAERIQHIAADRTIDLQGMGKYCKEMPEDVSLR